MEINDTIAAIATPQGEGGIGIVRISGDNAVPILKRIFRGRKQKTGRDRWESHRIRYGQIRAAATGETIDEVLVSIMLAPKTYTREDTVEIYCHGGIVPLRRTLEEVLRQGARLAEPGEFTKRAFLNGRIDLAQAEAVIDVIRAQTDRSLRMAIQQLDGRLSRELAAARDNLLEILAFIEASIDFPEDEIDYMAPEEIIARVEDTKARLEGLLRTAESGRILRDGLSTAIIGKPNVGKSSLLNALLRENRAIVTAIPGTTRDIIEETVNIQGIPLRIMDTAGIREAYDAVEIIGVQRAKETLQKAELILFLLDDTTGITEEDRKLIALLQGKKAIILVNKADAGQNRIDPQTVAELLPGKKILKISAQGGEGIEQLEEEIADMVFGGDVAGDDYGIVNNVRHKITLEDGLKRVEDILEACRREVPYDLIAIDVRGAWEKIGEITGDTVDDAVLDKIFAQFCIGK